MSFYNESPTGAVDPTPVIGMIGLLTRADRAVPSHARAAGDVVFVLGETRKELGGSAYWETCHDFVGGQPPRVDLDTERRLIDLLVAGADGDCSGQRTIARTAGSPSRSRKSPWVVHISSMDTV